MIDKYRYPTLEVFIVGLIVIFITFSVIFHFLRNKTYDTIMFLIITPDFPSAINSEVYSP